MEYLRKFDVSFEEKENFHPACVSKNNFVFAVVWQEGAGVLFGDREPIMGWLYR